MNKKLIALATIALLAVGAASAQLAVGLTGALYGDDALSIGTSWDRIENGDGVFGGGFIELGLGGLGLGLSVNASSYEQDWDIGIMVPLIDYDVALYAQAHLFDYDAFIDPFLEVGFGMMGQDFRETDTFQDPDPENPLKGTGYGQFGLGIGLNMGSIGIFWKTLWMVPGDPVTYEATYLVDGYEVTYTNVLDEYPLARNKTMLGVKLIL